MRTEISGTILVLALSASILFTSFASSSLIRTQTVASNGQIIYPNYTIWTEGGVYCVTDAHGAIAYLSPVASNALNYASTTLTTGGIIFVRNGTYSTGKWTINQPNIYVMGESWQTIFTIANGVNDAVIAITADNVTLNNIAVDGNMAGQNGILGKENGIKVYGGSYFTIEHCFVSNTYLEGIEATYGAHNGIIHGCTVKNTRLSGIAFYGKNGATASTNTRLNTVSDCIMQNNGLLGEFGNNLLFSGVDYCSAENITCDTASDDNFEIIGGGPMNVDSQGCTANNLVCVNATNVGILLDGTSGGAYHCVAPVVSNFYVENSALGLSLSTYVDNPVVSAGNIQKCSSNGIGLYDNVINGRFGDITINDTTADGVKVDGSSVYNVFDNITMANIGSYSFEVSAGNTYNTLQNSQIINATNTTYIQGDFTTVKDTLFYSGVTIGIYFTSNYNSILGNNISATGGWGIYGVTTVGSTIQNNRVTDPQSGSGGILVSGGASTNNLVSGNYVSSTTATGRTGILIWSSGGAAGNRVIGNTIDNCGTGINLNSVNVAGTIVSNNQLISCINPITDSGVNTAIFNNTGYNPVGYITNPFSGNNHIFLDLGGDNATWSSTVTYANWESPKTLYISNGTVTAVVQNGQTIFLTTDCTLVLQPGDTFSIIFSSAPTIKVEGH
jgi:hypothetical protein